MGIPIQQHVIAPGFTYQHHPDHRNRTAGKSQWTVSEADERTTFDYSRTNQWLAQHVGWGVYVLAGRATYLGVSDDGLRRLLIAKFVGSNSPKVWHGYPADHQKTTHDIPTTKILGQWMRLNLLRAAKVRKLMRGQPCNL
jgi:hypothetical protein